MAIRVLSLYSTKPSGLTNFGHGYWVGVHRDRVGSSSLGAIANGERVFGGRQGHAPQRPHVAAEGFIRGLSGDRIGK